MEKTAIVNWKGFELEITYDPMLYPEVQVTDIIYNDDQIPFFEKVQNSPTFIADVNQLAAEDYFDVHYDELEEREMERMQPCPDDIHERQFDK